jgi:uncharacterized membrane protein YkoI
MKTLHFILAASSAVLTIAATTAPAAKPKISMQTARAKALAMVPHGTVKSAELETEHGQLIYSFDIAAPKRSGIEEVQISALNGKLVSRTHETPAKEKKEAKAEAKEMKPK